MWRRRNRSPKRGLAVVARHDLVTDPRILSDLLLARRGTAFFGRKLHELSFAELEEPSLLPGWRRKELAAHVGYNARALARLVEWAASGVVTPMYESAEARGREIAFGATLPRVGLLNLFDHAAIHLSVEWRDLPDERWQEMVTTAQGREVKVSETVWMRAREVWLHAIDLDNGARMSEVPTEVLERLLTDVWSAWVSRGEDLPFAIAVETPGAAPRKLSVSAERGVIVSGTLPAVVAWATGRSAGHVTTTGGAVVPQPPRWI